MIIGGYEYSEEPSEPWCNIVSLGFFCGIAQEMEKYGLRSHSNPFDWLISNDFEKVMWLIQNNFSGFMLYENLAQYRNNPQYYCDLKNQLHFYHDFLAYKPLKNQYKKVYGKYKRRITYFYESVNKPTMFVRYCSTENEMEWIDQNYLYIDDCLKNTIHEM